MKSLLFSVIITALFLASCSPKANPTAVANTTNTDKLAQGQTIFENSCAKCHDLPNPTKYTDEKWVGILNAMAPKAKLTEEQHQLVYNYVTSKN